MKEKGQMTVAFCINSKSIK